MTAHESNLPHGSLCLALETFCPYNCLKWCPVRGFAKIHTQCPAGSFSRDQPGACVPGVSSYGFSMSEKRRWMRWKKALFTLVRNISALCPTQYSELLSGRQKCTKEYGSPLSNLTFKHCWGSVMSPSGLQGGNCYCPHLELCFRHP